MATMRSTLLTPLSADRAVADEAQVFAMCLAETNRKAGFLKLFGSKEVQDALVCTRNALDEGTKLAK